MKVAVAVKQVGELEAEFEPQADTRRIAPEALEWSLNDWDRFALEAALELRDAHGGEVVVLTVGAPEAEGALLACLAQGADRGVRIWDESIDPEPLTVARVLAAAVRRERPDLVLCGVQSSDAVNGATGVALAGLLDLPRVAVVRRLSYDAEAGSFEVDRELEGGLDRTRLDRNPGTADRADRDQPPAPREPAGNQEGRGQAQGAARPEGSRLGRPRAAAQRRCPRSQSPTAGPRQPSADARG